MPSPSDGPSARPARPAPPSSRPPPPKRRNEALYGILGLAFFGAAAALWLAGGDEPAPEPDPSPPAQQVARVNPIAEPELDLEPAPELEPGPDAGTAAPAPEPAKKRHAGGAQDGWSCSGELPVAQIRGVIDQYRPQVRTCYERRLKVNSILQGSLRLKLKVGASGDVVLTEASGTLRDAEVSACVRRLASGWRFPVPTGGRCAVVEAPFQFEPKGT